MWNQTYTSGHKNYKKHPQTDAEIADEPHRLISVNTIQR